MRPDRPEFEDELSEANSAWLEYQVRMGTRLDLENLSRVDRDVFKAIFQDGFNMGTRYAER